MGSNSAEIWMTLLFPDLLIIVKAIKFEKVSLRVGKISGLFFKTLTADQKYCLPNRQFDIANWDAIISKRENFFSSFFFFGIFQM